MCCSSATTRNVQRALNDDIRAMSVRDYIDGLDNAPTSCSTSSPPLRRSRSAAATSAPCSIRSICPRTSSWPASSPDSCSRASSTPNPYNYLEATVRAARSPRPHSSSDARHEPRRRRRHCCCADAAQGPVEGRHGRSHRRRRCTQGRRRRAGDGEGVADDDIEARLARKELCGRRGPTHARHAASRSRRAKWWHRASQLALLRRTHVDANSVNSSALSSLGAQTVFATPVDRKLPRIRIRTRQARELMGQKILVALDACGLCRAIRTATLWRAWPGRVQGGRTGVAAARARCAVPTVSARRSSTVCPPRATAGWCRPRT